MGKRSKTTTSVSEPVHASSPAHVATSSQPKLEDAAQSTRMNPIPRIPLHLPSMTPEQAYLLLDAIEWLHAAIWNAHEAALVDIIITRVDSPTESDSGDTSDDIPF